jgi:hypothetical protein
MTHTLRRSINVGALIAGHVVIKRAGMLQPRSHRLNEGGTFVFLLLVLAGRGGREFALLFGLPEERLSVKVWQ